MPNRVSKLLFPCCGPDLQHQNRLVILCRPNRRNENQLHPLPSAGCHCCSKNNGVSQHFFEKNSSTGSPTFLQVTDMVNSWGRNADLLLSGAILEGNLTALQASFLRTQLSCAFEDEKPVGDCELGLVTDTLLKGTQSHCFSPELLVQCANVRDTTVNYTAGVAVKLRATILAAAGAGAASADPGDGTAAFAAGVLTGEGVLSDAAEAFVEAMAARGAIATARVRCAAYESTIDLLGTAPRSVSLSLLVSLISPLVALITLMPF
ncbi:unnamed protein product [Phaeothamnion confervicola]